MSALQFSRACGHNGVDCQHHPRWKRAPSEFGRALPWIVWNKAPDRVDYLTIGVSLPKVLYGSNVEMLRTQSDIDRALYRISEYVSETAEARFDAKAANVIRVDFCHQWRLTPTQVCEYLRVVGSTSVSRMTRQLFDSATVQFSNKSQAVVFYDKLLEVLSRLRSGKATDQEVNAAVGVLRLEKRYLNYHACERLASKMGLSNRRVETLFTVSVAESVMNQTIRQLGLDRHLEAGDIRLPRLIHAYGPRRALFLAGLLAACDSYGAENLVRLGICKRSTFHKMRREIMQAGAWLVTDGKRSLRPLRIVEEQDIRAATA